MLAATGNIHIDRELDFARIAVWKHPCASGFQQAPGARLNHGDDMKRRQQTVVGSSFLARQNSKICLFREFIRQGLCFGIRPNFNDLLRRLNREAGRNRIDYSVEQCCVHTPNYTSLGKTLKTDPVCLFKLAELSLSPPPFAQGKNGVAFRELRWADREKRSECLGFARFSSGDI